MKSANVSRSKAGSGGSDERYRHRRSPILSEETGLPRTPVGEIMCKNNNEKNDGMKERSKTTTIMSENDVNQNYGGDSSKQKNINKMDGDNSKITKATRKRSLSDVSTNGNTRNSKRHSNRQRGRDREQERCTRENREEDRERSRQNSQVDRNEKRHKSSHSSDIDRNLSRERRSRRDGGGGRRRDREDRIDQRRRRSHTLSSSRDRYSHDRDRERGRRDLENISCGRVDEDDGEIRNSDGPDQSSLPSLKQQRQYKNRDRGNKGNGGARNQRDREKNGSSRRGVDREKKRNDSALSSSDKVKVEGKKCPHRRETSNSSDSNVANANTNNNNQERNRRRDKMGRDPGIPSP